MPSLGKKPKRYEGKDYCRNCGGEKVVHRQTYPYDYIQCPVCKGSGRQPQQPGNK